MNASVSFIDLPDSPPKDLQSESAPVIVRRNRQKATSQKFTGMTQQLPAQSVQQPQPSTAERLLKTNEIQYKVKNDH
ncbi:hypothetical protein KIN20_010165 [Parelaphostrongylus tenuis]|uniref:Uncharacterized protein n=1 Tax=Parelaphostrongylus tenuis TaxID=148309 RepID=A0AAD5MC60_PARTN|nr:hypothetical protein KIN20_010165 [Parelaphostrongylus tenuis]